MNNDNEKKTKNEVDFERGMREIDKSKSRASKKAAEEQHEAYKSKKERLEFERLLKDAANKSAASSKSKNRVLNNFAYRKDLAKIFRQNNASNGIDYKRNITVRYSSINYNHRNSKDLSLNALETSLEHSSRLKKQRTEEWHENQSYKNIFYADGKYLTHQDFVQNREQYLSFFNKIKLAANNKSDDKNKKDLAKYSRYRGSYFSKIKKLLPPIHPEYDQFVKQISKLEQSKNKTLDLSKEPHSAVISGLKTYLIRQYEILGFSPKHQENKLRVFDNYLSHRLKHQELKASSANRKVKNLNSTSISEQVFKIPHRHGEMIGVDKKNLLEACVSFFEKNFEGAKIKLAVLHADEGISDDLETGLNAHIFISPNANTPWSQQYILFAKKQAQAHYSEQFPELLSIDSSQKLSPKTLVACGQILQLSFLQHLQEKVFNQHDIGIRFLEENERKEFNNIVSMIEDSMPLHLRQQSRWNMLNDKSNELSQSIALQSEQLEAIKKATTQKQKKMLEAIEIWQLHPSKDTASLTLFQLEMIDELPEAIKTSLLAEITSFEQQNNIDSNAKLSNKINKP
ncbi:hypothetical protein L2755_07375 [Shewanella abyssi]|uniref:hypothetical protein n=1 Tax=Shewanella abyssi TaxID=311789 RepID=UPI002010596A|nr:hypothetical protein [Shewanella abyssi]MCL1049443.1 hypothetical protein [Shewanella abyssi]